MERVRRGQRCSRPRMRYPTYRSFSSATSINTGGQRRLSFEKGRTCNFLGGWNTASFRPACACSMVSSLLRISPGTFSAPPTRYLTMCHRQTHRLAGASRKTKLLKNTSLSLRTPAPIHRSIKKALARKWTRRRAARGSSQARIIPEHQSPREIIRPYRENSHAPLRVLREHRNEDRRERLFPDKVVECTSCGLRFVTTSTRAESLQEHYDEEYYRPWIQGQAAVKQQLWHWAPEGLECRG